MFSARGNPSPRARSRARRLSASARAVEDCDLLFIPRAEFLSLIKSNAELALRMIGSMSQHLRLLVNAVEDLQGKDVETRLIHWLLKRCPQPRPSGPFEIALDVTKTVLASELSTRNETLSRALARLATPARSPSRASASASSRRRNSKRSSAKISARGLTHRIDSMSLAEMF